MKYKFLGFLTLTLWMFVSTLSGQALPIPKEAPKGAVKAYQKGCSAMSQKDFKAAEDQFLKAIEKYPDFQSARLLLASAYYRMNELSLAEKTFLEVINGNDEIPSKVFLTLGMIQYKLDKFEEACENLTHFLSLNETNKDLNEKAKEFLEHSQFARTAVKDPVAFSPKPVSGKVNTVANEYAPTITADGKTMVFSRRTGGVEYLYQSENIDGQWSEPKPLDHINSMMDGGAHAISADGRLIVFTNCERRYGYGSCDLFSTRYVRGQWTKPQNMGLPVNSSAWDSQPTLSENGRTLYFSSNRAGSVGAKDIWVTHRRPGGKWTTPLPLDSTINTVKDEKSPFIHFDGETLYFMSNGHPGMGDFDLFYSRKLGPTKWSESKNLGYPLNTKYQEGTLIVDLSGQKAYITSDRHHAEALDRGEKINSETDIYEFDMPARIAPQPSTFVEFWVLDKSTMQPIAAEVVIANARTGKKRFSEVIQEDGYELVCLPLGQPYAIQVSHPEYTFFSERMEWTEERTATKPLTYRILLEKPELLKQEEAIVLKNVLFKTGSAELLEEAYEEIDFLYGWLDLHPEVVVEIRGHTDNVGGERENRTLSEERAQAVAQALVHRGLLRERVSWKGFGEDQPIADNVTEEGRKANRRTEFVLRSKN